jgi:hypothetical protein
LLLRPSKSDKWKRHEPPSIPTACAVWFPRLAAGDPSRHRLARRHFTRGRVLSHATPRRAALTTAPLNPGGAGGPPPPPPPPPPPIGDVGGGVSALNQRSPPSLALYRLSVIAVRAPATPTQVEPLLPPRLQLVNLMYLFIQYCLSFCCEN